MNPARLAVAHEAANLTELARAVALAALSSAPERAVEEHKLLGQARAAVEAADRLLAAARRAAGHHQELSFAEQYPEEAAADLVEWLRLEADRVPDGFRFEVLGEAGEPR